jgi:A/G-specific adenine glycosylase
MSHFSEQIQIWYYKNKRDLPWRETKNPYHIWLSEVILQQTRVQQGMDYYYKFVDTFEDIKALATASEQEVLNLWQGLGYYSRGRNLHKAAKMVVDEFKNLFPRNFDDIRKLPGVGNYTAAAIASFAYNLPHAVVDGNVYRVLSRYYNTDEFIDTPQGQKYYQALADELLDRNNPSTHNQAIMELGALICTPKNPSCESCPLSDSCLAKAKNTWSELPRKKGKVKVRNRQFHYFVSIKNDHILLQKRGDKDIWANMFEFPLIEGEKIENPILNDARFLKTMNHKLTHQNLIVNFYTMDHADQIGISHSAEWISIDALKDYPLPRVIERFLAEEYELASR